MTDNSHANLINPIPAGPISDPYLKKDAYHTIIPPVLAKWYNWPRPNTHTTFPASIISLDSRNHENPGHVTTENHELRL